VADYVRWPALAACACFALLGLLALLVFGDGGFRQSDLDLFRQLSAHQGGRAGELGEAIALLADPTPLIALTVAACGIGLGRRRPGDALAALVVVAGANVTTQLLKALLAHPRAQVLLGGSGAHQIAFPSGHTTAAFSIGIAFTFVLPRNLAPAILALAAAFGAAVGGSVVVITWHYPSDAVGGFLVAAGWGFAVLAALRAAELRRPAHHRGEEAAWPPPAAGFSPPGSPPSR
jgi:membrane-associated phospholipid phosphatase